MIVEQSRRLAISLGLMAAVGFGALGSAALAQDATETPEGVLITHPAHVHVGSCAELDPNPAYPLNNVGPRTDGDGNMPDPEEIRGSLTANPIMVSETEIEVNLDDLLETAHAINVHLSDQDITTYIACGDIGGPVLDDELYIGLMELNGSGYSGIARLEKDDDNTNVTVYLMQAPAQDNATPAA